LRHDNDTLRRDLISLKHGRDALELENASLQDENMRLHQELESLRSEIDTVRKQHQSLIAENRTLRTSNQTLITDNEDLRESLDGVQHELDAARELYESLQLDMENVKQEKTTLQEDNDSLVRHNEKYFNDNKNLRRENSGFERSLHDMHNENLQLKEEMEALRQQLDICRPIPKEDFSAQLDEETEENMTSAFFIPDITVNTNESGPADNTNTEGLPALPELTNPHTRLSTIPDVTEEQTDRSVEVGPSSQSIKQQRRKSITKEIEQPQAKVAFSIPEPSIRSSKSTSNLANQGSKRRSNSQSKLKKTAFQIVDSAPEHDDSTGLQLNDNTTQEQLIFNEDAKLRKSKQQDETTQSHKSQRRHSRSQSSQKQELSSMKMAEISKNSCPALSDEARRVLDELCEHNCRNCTVCSRISSHRGMLSSNDVASGKKRVTVPRPIPVTDRDLREDATMRPARSPGHALAMVIKGLEDEVQHLKLELTHLQAAYNSTDGAIGRRERLSISASINDLLKRLDAKNDQIYSLHDVLEGQKAVGQAMSEEEIEWTVLSITGMTVRDVTNVSEQLTWEGLPDL
jgi:predicted nuclease with TOPRIM domain